MKIFSKYIAGVSLLLCLLLPSTGQAESILAFGDSITQGVPYLTAPSNGGRNGGYEPFLEDFFLAAGQEVPVYNWGLAGDTTVGALTGTSERCDVVGEDEEGNPIIECHPVSVRTIDNALAVHGSAEYLFIMEGTNDFFVGISPQTTATNLCQIAARGQAYGMMPIIATITPDFRETGKSVETLNSYVISEAQNRGVKVLDLYSGLVGNWSEYVSPDQLHPNLIGYKAIARLWFNMFYNLQLITGDAVSTTDTIDTAKASLQGSASADGEISGLAFEYGPDESMKMSVDAIPKSGDGSSTIFLHAGIHNLQYQTKYYYRLISTFNGETFHGATKTFVTPERMVVLNGVYLLLL